MDNQGLTLTAPEITQCPFPTYDRIREASPAYKDAVTGFYIITRFDDIKAIAADPSIFSNNTGLLGQRSSAAKDEVMKLYEEKGYLPIDTLISNDPPSHRRYRALVDTAFTARRMRDVEPVIRALVVDLIDGFPAAAFDFVPQFAIPLPVRMIAEQLGVPTARADDFKRWSDALIGSANLGLTREQEIAIAEDIVEMQQFFTQMIALRRTEPDDSLLSSVVNTQTEGGDYMTDQEIVSILQQILVAGNETTTNTVASAVLRLAGDPVLQDRLRANPALISSFVEEVLRLEAPLQSLFRRATQAVEIGGVTIPEGGILELRWGAGNRDPRRFENADEVDLTRANASQHLAFGYGVHFCVGNQLARVELRTGIAELLARSKSIRLANPQAPLTYAPHFFARGLRSLPIQYEKA